MTFVVEQGDRQFEATPLSNGETVEEFYSYRSDGDPHSHTSTDIEASDVSHLFLYEDPDGAVSLVVLHDAPFDSGGGKVTFTFEGLPDDGEWVVRDDDPGNDTYFGRSRVEWMWNSSHTDGGAYRDVADAEEVTVTPRRFEGIREWRFLSGDPSQPDAVTLDLAEQVTIRQNVVTAQMTTLSFFPGLNENSAEGGDELNSALPHVSDTAPVIDDWFHGDFQTELEDDLVEATIPDKRPAEFDGETFHHYRFKNQVEVSFTVDDDGSISEDRVTVDTNDDRVFVTLEDENNPLRAFGVNDLLFGGDVKKRASPRPRHLEWDVTEVDGTDAVRVSTIWGTFDPFVENMLEYVVDTTIIALATLLGVPLVGLAADFISTTPTIYTWNELTVTADGARLARVWDASRFPAHVGYMERTRQDEVPFERGEHWRPRERSNDRFDAWVFEEQTHRLVPYETPHLAYLRTFAFGDGPHPVMAYGIDADGTTLDEREVRDRLPDEPLDPF